MVTKGNFLWVKWSRIVYCSLLVGIVVGILTGMFQMLVETYEDLLFSKANKDPILFFIFPIIGLILIYFLRKYFFKNKQNKGISEVLVAIYSQKKMPAYKVTSHFFNGFLTVIFGGSTGIEVSTVVATSTLGDLASRKDVIFKKYRKEFMGSAIAAGVSMLFGNPLAGLFFSFETIRKQNTKVFWVTHLGSILFAYLVGLLLNVHPLFDVSKLDWNFSYLSIPFWIALSIVSALYGVYMTRMVTFVKSLSWRERHPILTILVGGLVLGMFLFFFTIALWRRISRDKSTFSHR